METPRSAALVAEASKRLESYERVSRAALAHREGPARPPILQLADDQLKALFAPRQLESLVGRPLGRAELSK